MKILVPVDDSQSALDAARYALRLKRQQMEASFLLATVQEPTFRYEMVFPPGAVVLEPMSGAIGLRALAAAEALFEAEGVPFEREIGSGDPAAAVIEMARRLDCEAIVLGARGHGALRSALLGSVSQGTLQGSNLPVTIVKHAEGAAAAA